VDDYISEKEQIEQVRQWLSENGRSITRIRQSYLNYFRYEG